MFRVDCKDQSGDVIGANDGGVLSPARGTYCTSVLWILIAAAAIADQLCKLLWTPGHCWLRPSAADDSVNTCQMVAVS